MFHPRPCGCKGQRTCLICEKDFDVQVTDNSLITEELKEHAYVFCPLCDEMAWPGWELDSWKSHPNHEGVPIRFKGVRIVMDFISEAEEEVLLRQLDEVPWDLSQSGRRKQNYGPKCNFKKRRVKLDGFDGYPAFSHFIQERFKTVPILKGFQTVEQCSLEYSLERGASIDPHIDDCWIWGERIPTLSMLSDSVLTLKRFQGPANKYNLSDTIQYVPVVDSNSSPKDQEVITREMEKLVHETKEDDQVQSADSNNTSKFLQECKLADSGDVMPELVRLPMFRRSLLVFYGSPRYEWEHGIYREDIRSRRVCITYRELTPLFLEGGPQAEIGQQILEIGKKFWDHKVRYNLNNSDCTVAS
ncbi:alpha-ketoglutarate-dependent dioxygenase alkB homolog 4 [Oratosquilla oratoria]|uniref:alpha-ketoglutarate-dependent dioxygenase alkB homolog 4 n=1 Tax=Oratosquilla oratoria TaxID=337810 RepID=UPI003F760D4D